MIPLAALALAASVAWVLGTTIGYSRYLARRARRASLPEAATRPAAENAESEWLSVTAIVATREPAAVIEARVRDLRRADYPAHLLDIVIGVDASGAPALVPALRAALAHDAGCRVVAGESPGKAGALNAAVAAASGDVLLFADSHQSFPPELARRLVRALDAPGVGAATGLVATPEDDGFSASYWKAEQQVRAWQSAHHSVICVTGAVYAMPRRLYTRIPDGTICDDLFSTMTLASAGHRVVLVPEAVALDPRRFTGAEQYRRRVRTMTGLLQLIRSHGEWLRPAHNPMWLDLWVHKVNRLALPWVVLAGAVAGGVLAFELLRLLSPAQRSLVYGAVAVAALGVVFVLLASRRLRERVTGVARAFLVPVVALANGVRGRWNVWAPVPVTARAAEPASPAAPAVPSPHS